MAKNKPEQGTKPATKSKPAAKKAAAFNSEKFEADRLPTLSVLARTKGEDQIETFGGRTVTVFQDGTYAVASEDDE